MTRTLHCQLGDHDWEAPVKRGRYPKNCPDCKVTPAKPASRAAQADADMANLTAAQDLPLSAWTFEPKREPHIRRVIEAVMADSRSEGCRCGITPDMDRDELNALCCGCCAPRWACPTLDRIRRLIGYRPEVIYDDV